MKVKNKSINFNVDTYNDISNIVDMDVNDVCIVAEEGRGGTFIYRGTGVYDGGTIINGWHRQYEGAVNIRWFGAISISNVGYESFDSTQSIINALDASNAIYVPKGRFLITSTITIPQSRTIIGEHKRKSIFFIDSDIDGFWTQRHTVMKDIRVMATGQMQADKGCVVVGKWDVGLYGNDSPFCSFTNCIFGGGSIAYDDYADITCGGAGVLGGHTFFTEFIGCQFYKSVHGYYNIDNAALGQNPVNNMLMFQSCNFGLIDYSGIAIRIGQGVHIDNCDFEVCRKRGIYAIDSRGLVITSCYFEGNAQATPEGTGTYGDLVSADIQIEGIGTSVSIDGGLFNWGISDVAHIKYGVYSNNHKGVELKGLVFNGYSRDSANGSHIWTEGTYQSGKAYDYTVGSFGQTSPISISNWADGMINNQFDGTVNGNNTMYNYEGTRTVNHRAGTAASPTLMMNYGASDTTKTTGLFSPKVGVVGIAAEGVESINFTSEAPRKSGSGAQWMLIGAGDNANNYKGGIKKNGGSSPWGIEIHTPASFNATASRLLINNTQTSPGGDNLYTLGSATKRWSTVYSATGTINTSDDREKTYIDVTDIEKEVALEIKANMRKFKFNNAIETKGENGARIHFGASAQTVKSIFESHGLVAEDYAILCYDEWEEELDEDGNIVTEAGNRYGLRYEELLCFLIGAM